MAKRIKIQPLGRWAKAADKLMYPLMRILMELNGTPDESPQQTHRWNNRKLSAQEALTLDESLMCLVPGDSPARVRWFSRLPLFHLPVFGWQEYAVLRPLHWRETWYVGWATSDVTGVSLIPAKGEVRCLVGREDVYFFALNAAGQQIPIEQVGAGRFGYGSMYKTVPLH